MVVSTGAGWTAALVLEVLSTSCLPSTPETPVGVRLAGAGSDISGLEITYLACPEERVTEFNLERSTTRSFDGADVIWSVTAEAEGVEARGEQRIDPPVGDVPEPFEVTRAPRGRRRDGGSAGRLCRQRRVRRHYSSLFTLDQLEQDRIFINGRFFTDDGSVERYSCEHHRGRLW